MFLVLKTRLLFVLLTISLVLSSPGTAQAYIGPGAGFAVMGSFLVMFTAILSALMALLTWPIRYIIRTIRNRKALSKSRVKKVVILGLDGLDPSIAETFMAEGKLPNLSKLNEQGCFKKLGTSIPSISPVAWSTFQTGTNPGKHNIFDFMTRSPKSYSPILSSVEIKGSPRTINLGKYRLPVGRAVIKLLRKSRPFWKILGEHGIFSNIIRVPITFPPEKFNGVQLSAMCVPDLRGTQGMFSFYTTKIDETSEHTGGERFQVVQDGDTIHSELIGPPNPFKENGQVLKIPFEITITDMSSASMRLNGKLYRLDKDVYTDWIRLKFKAAPGINVHGICRFLLLGVSPEFELYVTPINIDPAKPVMPISHPRVYATYLAKLNGTYATLGLAEDTWALNEKVLKDDDFLTQCIQIDKEREKMFLDALDKVRQGLCVCVFDGTDRVQHAFWRHIDKKHPVYDKDKLEGRDAIEEVYQRMDQLVGEAMVRCNDRDSVLMVISDHGFASFRYGVDLNRWLEEQGYLKVMDGKRPEKHLAAVDWSQTSAFAIGLAGIYLNIKGREAQGIVSPGEEADKLRREIAEKLEGLTDTERGETAVVNVYNAMDVYKGPYKENAPDLIVGYNRGYRASWENAIGLVTEAVFHTNRRAWSGDHCIDPALVPGVLFCNRHIEDDNPRLIDLGPTVLDMFGIGLPGYMDGKALAVAEPD